MPNDQPQPSPERKPRASRTLVLPVSGAPIKTLTFRQGTESVLIDLNRSIESLSITTAPAGQHRQPIASLLGGSDFSKAGLGKHSPLFLAGLDSATAFETNPSSTGRWIKGQRNGSLFSSSENCGQQGWWALCRALRGGSGRTVRRVSRTMFVRAAETVRRPGDFALVE